MSYWKSIDGTGSPLFFYVHIAGEWFTSRTSACGLFVCVYVCVCLLMVLFHTYCRRVVYLKDLSMWTVCSSLQGMHEHDQAGVETVRDTCSAHTGMVETLGASCWNGPVFTEYIVHRCPVPKPSLTFFTAWE